MCLAGRLFDFVFEAHFVFLLVVGLELGWFSRCGECNAGCICILLSACLSEMPFSGCNFRVVLVVFCWRLDWVTEEEESVVLPLHLDLGLGG